METTLQLAAWGGSTALRIPKIILQQLNLTEKSTVEIKVDGNGLIVKPLTQEPTLRELFINYTGEYRGEELDWGEDVEGEIICETTERKRPAL
ncbi:MAG: AbrB/MazE/SpoVT family DNA-binding domain-containing protein [Oscillospiraceae bacterium]|nr:AbrB/MazE/SpoVT family DNA-binding domain-containing protein [Oscillospiraceae bacterium]